jgi:alpha-tubulin suppressor-like RCC1 family protein
MEATLTLMEELRREEPEAFYVVKVSLGTSHSAVVTKSGEVFTAGSNVDGQLGIQGGNCNESSNQEDPDEVLFSPLNQVLPYGDQDCPSAKDVFCGDSFTLILDSSNNVQIFGKSTDDQIQESIHKL